jgi:hypothetical protein
MPLEDKAVFQDLFAKLALLGICCIPVAMFCFFHKINHPTPPKPKNPYPDEHLFV